MDAENTMNGRYLIVRNDDTPLRTWEVESDAFRSARALDDWQGVFGPHRVVDLFMVQPTGGKAPDGE